MDACGCNGLAAKFDRRIAERDRDRYRRQGPDRTTRLLLDLLGRNRVGGATILDIGGGIGIIDRELLAAGAGHAVIVDAAPAYLRVAREVARAANLLDRIEFVDGDFVERAAEIGTADIVTLDRVVCCYADADALVGLSAAKANSLYGLVLPRDRWFIRTALRVMNVGFWLRRMAYRARAHPNGHIDALVAGHGLQPHAEARTLFWRVVVYDRAVMRPTAVAA
ncbi:MAG: methyltransferase domain-containing protein [Chloroflexi bacterium]|nr:methyltransferase domain-containing protein [Chloroflexota bacterium]